MAISRPRSAPPPLAQHVIPEANSYRDAIVGGAESVLALEEALF